MKSPNPKNTIPMDCSVSDSIQVSVSSIALTISSERDIQFMGRKRLSRSL